MTNAQDPKWVASGLTFWRSLLAKTSGAKARARVQAQLAMFEHWARALGLPEAHA